VQLIAELERRQTSLRDEKHRCEDRINLKRGVDDGEDWESLTQTR
jgi:hypothetical protein